MNRKLNQTALLLLLCLLPGALRAQVGSDSLLVDDSAFGWDYGPAIFPATLELELETCGSGIKLDLAGIFMENQRKLQFSSWSWSFDGPIQGADEHLVLPDIPRGFFCKWEDELIRKGLPIDFGTD